jgi:uncharacterized membrane protein
MSVDRAGDAGARAQALERAIGFVLRAGVLASSACLATGLALSLVIGEQGAALFLLHAGVILLLITPVARVVVSIAQFTSVRDWTFTGLTVIVLVELMASAVAALVFNKRL